MPIQKVEYEFPDPDKTEAAAEVEVETKVDAPEIEVEGAVGREVIEPPAQKPTKVEVVEDKEVEVEVVDDTPQADRGRKASDPPEEVTNEELENYSEKVKKRINHFSKGYHDERRAKETAERQKEEAIAYAQQLIDENKKLKGNVNQSHNTLIESAKKQTEGEVAIASKKYKEAYESGEPDAIVAAQTELNTAQIRAEKVKALKPRAVTTAEATLQPQQNTVQSQVQQTQQPVKDERAEAWRDENPWFGSDDEMTALALGLHTKLTKENISPQSDEYYEKINSRMREVFPSQFDEGIEDEPETPKKKSSNVVAPATRSTKPNKVTLSQTQVTLAKRLGVPLEDYAQQVADLRGNRNG
tara:strand:- start:1355 stop:2425 length:1071 start_codon:yes stop_codon:yes gene_type:complete